MAMSSLQKASIMTLAVIGCLLFLRGKIAHERFDSDRWKEGVHSEETSTLRWDMMNSLRMKHRLKGMSKSDIMELLGHPDGEWSGTFWYYLGFSKRGIDTGYLYLYFDETDRVARLHVSEG